MKPLCIICSFLFLLALSAFDFTPYKTIVCFGDSHTHGGYYHIFLQEYLAETDPAHPRHVINSGISGNTVDSLLKRVDKMLEKEKPDLVMVMIGGNDLMFTTKFAEANLPFDEAYKKYPVFQRYEKELGTLLDILNKAGVKVILLSSPPYNESANPAITATLNPNMNSSGIRNLQVIQKRLAEQKGVVWIDVYTPMMKNLQENEAKLPRGTGDRVHPSKAEHLILAQTIIGKEYVPGAKQNAAERYRKAQHRIQEFTITIQRPPASCKTVDEQIAYCQKWVASLKGADYTYWNAMLPSMIDTLKNKEAKEAALYQEREAAFNELYSTK